MDGNTLMQTIRSAGGVMLPNNKTHTHRIQIKSESSFRLYTVARSRSQNRWECSCPGWIHRRRCKHLEVMMPILIELQGYAVKSIANEGD